MSKVAIYVPPAEGLPYLVVAFARDGMRIEEAGNRDDARQIALAIASDLRPAGVIAFPTELTTGSGDLAKA